MTSGQGEDDQGPLDRAADWLVTLTSGQATAADARELAAWRERDPRNDEAFRHVARLTGLTRELIDNPPVRVDRRAMLAGGIALFGVGGLLGLTRPPLGMWPSLAELLADHRTGVGQRLSFTPTAGVTVDLNSKTSASLVDGGLAVRLVNGEALVTVDKSGGDFTVAAGDMVAATSRATFAIRSLGAEVEVTCVEGQVACTSPGSSARLAANERLAIDGEGAARRGAVNARAATAWRDGLLVFEDTPLDDAVRQINRYRAADIVITDEAARQRPVNAVLHTAQIENAVNQIQQSLGLTVRRLPGGIILIG